MFREDVKKLNNTELLKQIDELKNLIEVVECYGKTDLIRLSWLEDEHYKRLQSGEIMRKESREEQLEAFLVEAVGYVCDYLNDWENNHPESYSSSDQVAYMNDFLKDIENFGSEKLTKAIKPNG